MSPRSVRAARRVPTSGTEPSVSRAPTGTTARGAAGAGDPGYRGGFPEPLLLTTAFPSVQRVTARAGANRRDRLTARLPMLRRPHPEGGLGALRVEVRGRRGSARDEYVLGAIDRPGVAAGAVAAMAAAWVGEGRLIRPGAGGLAELVEPTPFLASLAERGVKAAVFEGSSRHGKTRF